MQAIGLDLSFSEKRRHKRSLFTVTFDYSCGGPGGGGCADGKGLSTNLSAGGLGFYTYMPLEKGQAITVHSGHISRGPVPATVMWRAKISEHMFKVGLMFDRRSN